MAPLNTFLSVELSPPQEITFPIGQAELSTPEFRAAHKAVSGPDLLPVL